MEADKLGLHGPLMLKIIEILEEQHPGRLLGIVQLRRATRLFPEDVIDILAEGDLGLAVSIVKSTVEQVGTDLGSRGRRRVRSKPL